MAILIADDLTVPVKLSDLRPQMVLALLILDPVFAQFGEDVVLTSANDGDHGAIVHYVGLAVDLRTRGIPKATLPKMQSAALKALGGVASEYDLLIESNHFHLEWDPR